MEQRKFTQEEKEIIATFLKQEAISTIPNKSMRNVDMYAKTMVEMLQNLGFDKEADDVYKVYTEEA